ncbi:MAG TPA: aldehyde dehydrogenase family protein, partial [Puia sp.]
PFQLALLPMMSALAAGNTVVLKPSELASATAALIEKMLAPAFPDTVRVVTGDGAVVVPELIRAFHFDHIFFTGSVGVGRSIYRLAAERLIPVTLELGGKSPVIVEPDADLPTAARRIVMGKFINAGQTCIAPDYLLVQEEIKDRLVQQMRETMRQFYGGTPADSPDLGKIINGKRWETLISYLPQGNIICGGEHDRARLYIAPTLLEVADFETPLMKEEIFGPLLPVVSYKTMEEALAIIRRNPNPLAFYLFTRDKARQKAWMEALPFGGGCINNTDWHFTNPGMPFGGVGSSGIGAYHGKSGFDTFTHGKAVMRTPIWLDLDIKYPPFKGKMKWFKFFLK